MAKAKEKKTPAKAKASAKAKAKAPAKATAKAKPAAKAPAKAKKEIKRVPPRIVRRPTAANKQVAELPSAEVAKQSVDAATSIALALKRRAQADAAALEKEIKLSRRPTTRAQGKMTEHFPAADLKDFRKRLMDARQKALNGIDAMRDTGFNESDDHEADGGDGTNQTLRLQALGQMGNIKRTLQQIDEALHRIDDGSYGVCTSCGQLIRKPRLLNQPFVLTCMECQNEMERNRG